jgi:hypothetical protein
MPSRSQLAALLALTLALGCQRGSGTNERLGPIERVNTEPGGLGVFTFPYYTSIAAVDGGGAVAVYMRQEEGFRPVVYRRAPSAAGAFSDEQYLSPESMRDTISIIPDLRPGPAANELYLTWQARRNATGDKFVMFRRSTDGGATWETERRINSKPTSFIPSLATDADGGIYAVWVDERKRGFGLYFNRSLDHGQNWLVEDTSLEGSDEKYGVVVSVDIATDGKGTLVIVWEEDLGKGRRVHTVTSNDRGATWSDPAYIDDGEDRLSPSQPRVVFAGGRAVAVWNAAASGMAVKGELWADVSSDGGKTWGKDVLVSNVENGIPPRFHLKAFGDTARMVFHAGPHQGPWRIYYNELGADGTWRTGDEIPTVSAGDDKFSNPRLAIDRDGAFYVTYERHQQGVLLSRSTDGGKTWTPLAEPVYELPADREGDAVHYPQVTVAGGLAYVTWETWASAKSTIKTLADAQNKTRPADLFVRRVTFPQR